MVKSIVVISIGEGLNPHLWNVSQNIIMVSTIYHHFHILKKMIFRCGKYFEPFDFGF